MRYILTCICIIAAVGIVTAETINVPGDYSTIQAGIDAAVDGDIVLVADGTYTGTGNKNISLDGKAITLESVNGSESCIINCESNGRGFYLHNYETEASIIRGFTIKNGSMGAMFLWNCTPILEEIRFVENTGSALYLSGAAATVRHCLFDDNTTGSNGGGLIVSSADPVIESCTFYSNQAAYGGAVSLASSNATFTGCIFNANAIAG